MLRTPNQPEPATERPQRDEPATDGHRRRQARERPPRSHRLRQLVADTAHVHDPRPRPRPQLLAQPAGVGARCACCPPRTPRRRAAAPAFCTRARAPRPARAAARTPWPTARPASAEPHRPRERVDRELPTRTTRRVATPLGASQHRADAGEQLGVEERLRQMIVRPPSEAPHPVGLPARPVSTITGRSGSIREAKPSAARMRSSRSRPLPSSRMRSRTTKAGWRTSIARSPSPAPLAPARGSRRRRDCRVGRRAWPRRPPRQGSGADRPHPKKGLRREPRPGRPGVAARATRGATVRPPKRYWSRYQSSPVIRQ